MWPCNEQFTQYRELSDSFKAFLEEFKGAVIFVKWCVWFEKYKDILYWVKRVEVVRFCWSLYNIFPQLYFEK